MKLDEFEMRDYPNERMINHFKKMIGVTQKRIGVAKGRYDGLMKEYNGLVGTSEMEDEKNRAGRKEEDVSEDDLSSSSYLDALESDDDDDDEGLDDNDCEIELSFDGCTSTTSRVDRNLDKNLSSSSNDEHTQVTTDI